MISDINVREPSIISLQLIEDADTELSHLDIVLEFKYYERRFTGIADLGIHSFINFIRYTDLIKSAVIASAIYSVEKSLDFQVIVFTGDRDVIVISYVHSTRSLKLIRKVDKITGDGGIFFGDLGTRHCLFHHGFHPADLYGIIHLGRSERKR